MKDYNSVELGIKISYPDGWQPVNNDKIMTEVFGMTDEEASGTAFLLVKDAETEADFAYFTFSNDENFCDTEAEYEKILEENLNAFRDSGDEVILKDPVRSAKNIRIDKAVVKEKIGDDAGEFAFTILYFFHANDQLMFGMVDEVENENDENVMILDKVVQSVSASN